MRRKALSCIRQHQMIRQGDRLVVGVSGGADSVALLHFLSSIAKEWRLNLSAVHLNHNLRGDESLRDEEFVRELCARWQVELFAHSITIRELARSHKQGIEECARNQRYLLFDRYAQKGGKIATAHTLNDSVETLLLNLARGTGLRGLCGIPPVRGNIIRPLITSTRQEIEAYCRENGLEYVTDSSNLGQDYARNRIRHSVIPVLEQGNPKAVERMGETLESLREDAAYLDGLGREALSRARRGDRLYDGTTLLQNPLPVCKRAFLELMRRYDIPLERRRLEQVMELVETDGALQLSGRWICRSKGGELSMLPAGDPALLPVQPVSVQLGLERTIISIFSGRSLCFFGLDYEDYKRFIKIHKKLLKNSFDYDRIDKIVHCRPRMPGDRIRLAGRGCTKTLKQLYNEAALTANQRANNVVLASGDQVLWVEGFGPAETVMVRDDTRRVLMMEILEDASCTKI